MKIIGCDFHTRQQQIAMLDTETGELVERQLQHENGEARKFYEQLAGPVRVGIEATGYTLWFEKMLAELGQELWAGDAAKIRASVVRKQKTDKRDAAHILDFAGTGSVSADLDADAGGAGLAAAGVASREASADENESDEPAARDGDGPGALPEEEVVEQGGAPGTGSVAFGTVGGAAAARSCWPCSISGRSRLRSWIGRSSNKRKLIGQAVRLMTHPGVGPVTSLAFVLTVGTVRSFSAGPAGEQLSGSGPAHGPARPIGYGADRSASRAARQRAGCWSKPDRQRPALDPELRRVYQRLKFRRGNQIAKVAVARRLAVRLYWMLRTQVGLRRTDGAAGSHAG